MIMLPVAQQADTWLFRLLNLGLVHPAVDDLMVFLTSPELSGHIFMLVALFMVVRKGWDGIVIIVLVLLAVGISDQTASGLMKPLFQRVRPCFALDGVRLLIDQPGSWSFASSHAANSASAASVIWLFFWKGEIIDKVFSALMIFYGLLVAFSRIYVGVHYPGDVLAGMVIGVASALLVYIVASWLVKNVMHRRAMHHPGVLP